jgi:hypothetical protein
MEEALLINGQDETDKTNDNIVITGAIKKHKRQKSTNSPEK